MQPLPYRRAGLIAEITGKGWDLLMYIHLMYVHLMYVHHAFFLSR